MNQVSHNNPSFSDEAQRLNQQLDVFKAVLSSSPDFHFLLDTNLRFTFQNKEVEYDLDLIKQLQPQLTQVLSGKVMKGELSLISSVGETAYFEYVLVPVSDHQDKLYAVSGTVRDITELKRAKLLQEISSSESILENERENFRNLFRQTPEMVCILRGPEHLFEFVNEAHVKVLGFDATGKTVRQAQPESVEVHGILDNVYRTGKTADLNEIPVTLGDRIRYFNLTYTARRDENQNINGIMILGVEVTEQVHIRRETAFRSDLGLELSKLTTVDEMIPAITNGLGMFLGATRCWVSEIDNEICKAKVHVDYHRNLPSLQGVYDLNVFGPEMVASWREGNLVCVRNVETDPRTKADAHAHLALGIHSFITMPLIRDGQLVSALNVSVEHPRHWTDGELELVRSITEGLWNSVEKARAQESTVRALHARDEFLTIASHELKTPITSLKMQLQLGQRQLQSSGETPSPDRLGRFYALSILQVNRLAALVENLLDVTKIESGKLTVELEPVDLTQLAKEVLESLKDQLERSGCKALLDSLVPVVIKGDRFRLEQVLLNLMTNAMKYGPGLPIQMSIRKEPSKVVLTVKDNGMGIEKTKQQIIFERFERAIDARNISGMGLGLYISRQIVEAHRGTISVESEPGLGSTFIIELPV